MDKIREQQEFVEWLTSQKMYNSMESALAMQKMFRVFVAVNKSRDEEIKNADDTIHKQYIIYSKNQKEIKKLRDALISIQQLANIETISTDQMAAIYVRSEEALKDNK